MGSTLWLVQREQFLAAVCVCLGGAVGSVAVRAAWLR